MQKKMVGWDFGNVMGLFSLDVFFEDLARIARRTPKDIRTFFYSNVAVGPRKMIFWHAIETFSYWTPERIYKAFCEQFQDRMAELDIDYFIETFNRALWSDPRHKERFLALSKKIDESGHIQHLISNANSIHAENIEGRFGNFLHYIPKDLRYFSCEMGMRKSKDPCLFFEIFDRIELLYKIKRKNIFFVDDRYENIIGAEKAGAKGFQFSIGDGIYSLEKRLIQAGLKL